MAVDWSFSQTATLDFDFSSVEQCERRTVFRLPSPPIDSIRAVTIVWRFGGNIIRTVLCSVVYDSCAQ